MDDTHTNTILICGYAVSTLFLLITLIIYIISWKNGGPKILKVLFILLANQVCLGLFETIKYLFNQSDIFCIIGIIGQLFFTIAIQYWIIFITRLIYRQALAPGKFFNLMNFFFKNIAMTYLPSLVVSCFLLIIIFINDSVSESQCWRILTQTTVLDTIVYFTSFILPNLVGIIIILGYLYYFNKFTKKKWTKYLFFPIFSVIYGLYYISVKMYLFFGDSSLRNYLEIPLIIEPISYAILFLYVSYVYSQQGKIVSSDLTIRDSEIEASFIEDL